MIKLICRSFYLYFLFALTGFIMKGSAATITYQGSTTGTQNWTTGANWSGSTAPAASSDVVISLTNGDALVLTSVPTRSFNSLTITVVSGTASVTMQGASSTMTLGGNTGTDLTIGSGVSCTYSGTGSICNLTMAASSTSSVAGSLTISSGSTLLANGTSFTTSGSLQINGTLTPAAACLIEGAGTLSGTGTIKVTRTAATADLPSQYTISGITLTGFTVDYSAGSAQTINAYTYKNLTVSGAGTRTLGGNTEVTGVCTVSAGTLALSSNSLTLSGSGTPLAVSGTFTANTGKVVYSSASPNVAGLTYYDLELSTSGSKTLSSAATVSNNLYLSGSILITTSTNLLSITNNSTSAIVGTPSATNAIQGPIRRTLAASVVADGTTYLYPLTDGTNYKAFELVNVRTGTAPVVTITYAATGASTVTGTHINSVDGKNWRVQLNSGTLTSFTARITDPSLTSTTVIGYNSTTQSGNYAYVGANSIGATITSNSGMTAGYFATAFDAVATKLVFTYTPPLAKSAANFVLTVSATDESGNVDNDNTSSVTLAKYSGTGVFSSASGLTQSLASGVKTWTDLQYTVNERAVFQATTAGLTMDTTGLLFVSNNVYYVNGTLTSADVYTTSAGNDANAGTANAPKLTLNGAYTVASANDYIYVDAGTYSGANNRELLFNKAGLKIIGAPYSTTTGYATIFTKGSGTDRNFLRIQGNNIELHNLEIYGFENITASYGSALDINGVTGVVISNVQMHDNGESGGEKAVKIYANTGVTFSNGGTTCNNVTGATSGGFYIAGNNIDVTYEDYVFYKNVNDNSSDHGSAIEIQSGTSQNITIRDSRFADNQNVKGGAAIYSNSSGANIKVYNSVFDNNDGTGTTEVLYGLCVELAAGTARFSNCIFKNTSGSSSSKYGTIATTSSSVTLTLDSCLFANNAMSSGNDLYINGGTVSCTNTTFSSSSVNIVRAAGSVTLVKCTNGSTPAKSGTITDDGVAVTYTSTANPLVNYSGSCGSVVLLPVIWQNFNATCENGNVKLTWKTLSEQGNARFEVLGSGNGYDFNLLGSLQGNGTTSQVTDYEFAVVPLKGDYTYYKLKQVDFDGNSTESDLLNFTADCNNAKSFGELNLYFNIAANSIELFAEKLLNGQVHLFDLSGRELKTLDFQTTPDESHLAIPIVGLTPGIYIALVKLEGINFLYPLRFSYTGR